MHVATAIRYGSTGFITGDLDDLVRKSSEIASAFNGFLIMSAEDALDFVRRVKDRFDQRNS